MEDIIGNVFDVENNLRQNFRKKVSSGALQKECAKEENSGCPWVPSALRAAEIKEFSSNAAVARVKTQTQATTWLGLCRKKDRWVIVGWADMEETARRFAEREASPSPEYQNRERKSDNSGKDSGSQGKERRPMKGNDRETDGVRL
ncbi:MAG: hypothetical protein K5657_07195 [Desulfovibrio sp.]|nr:hypothetical protein [Desulfovibrio sp.]